MTERPTNAWQRFWHQLFGADAAPSPATEASPQAANSSKDAEPASAAAATPPAPLVLSTARTEEEYRRECARHLYERYAERIYQGQLPPMLYAIGSLELYLDAQGQIQGLNWLREPSHAPEVVQQIEDMVYDAAPFPAVLRLATCIYTETWLWDESGRFQLHTLTEGQR